MIAAESIRTGPEDSSEGLITVQHVGQMFNHIFNSSLYQP